jgi:RNA polymerase sigma-54 factor
MSTMKHGLQLRQSQQITLTPQLQLSIRLLQLSTLEMQQELDQILQENPMLERLDQEGYESSSPPPDAPQTSSASGSENDSGPDGGADSFTDSGLDSLGWDGAGAPRDEDDDVEPQTAAPGASLRDHLLAQLTMLPLEGRDLGLVRLLIEALDGDGYLSMDLEEMLATLNEEALAEATDSTGARDDPVEIDELLVALRHVQNMEPAGVGARNLPECLLLQLATEPPDTPYLAEARAIAKDYLSQLGAREHATIRNELRCSEAALRRARELIVKLNPKPGACYSVADTHYVAPDILVKKVKGLWLAQSNPDVMPKLRVNQIYADILRRNRDKGSGELAGQLQEARFLIKNIQQRYETIQRVAQAIVDRQRQFLEHGAIAMRPLILRDIAETLDLHESTISRVTNQKYMLTPRGLFELKYFFSSHVDTETGGTASSTAIRALIKDLVAAENPGKPLSDSKLADIIGEQGIIVARRTVAKYRELLEIPPAHLRKPV